MGKLRIVIFILIIALLGGLFLARGTILDELKARGILQYTPEEAQALAFNKCGQCHSTERISKYCFRCGPPLIVVVHNMKILIKLEQAKGRKIESYTDAQAVAIAQVWNAIVGNWEDTWRYEDLVKLLEGDEALLRLLDTPVKDRPIEMALSGKRAPGAYEYQKPMGPMKPQR